MVKNSFTCNDCNKSFLDEQSAIDCERKHEEDRLEKKKIMEKNNKMVFSCNVEVKEEDLETQFPGVKIKIKGDYNLIILMGNRGFGYQPYKCLLPHQMYVNDIRESFEENDFEVIYFVGIKSKDVIPVAYKDQYGFQRWVKTDELSSKQKTTQMEDGE